MLREQGRDPSQSAYLVSVIEQLVATPEEERRRYELGYTGQILNALKDRGIPLERIEHTRIELSAPRRRPLTGRGVEQKKMMRIIVDEFGTDLARRVKLVSSSEKTYTFTGPR